MKYTINYNLYGGSTLPERTSPERTSPETTSPERTPIEDLPVAFSIYEFKSSIGLLPKAIEQNIKNIDRCKKGAYKLGDKTETLKFKTNNETKKVILINDSYDTHFNSLFMEIQYVHRSIDDLVAGRNIQKIKDRIKKYLDTCYKIANNIEHNIYVLDKDNEIRPIASSLLFQKFISYISTFDTIYYIRTFLLDNLKKDPEKEIYINNYRLLIDLEKQITGPKLEQLASQLNVQFKFKNKRLYPYIIIRDEYELNDYQLNLFNEITENLNKIKAPDGRTIIQIYDMLNEQKKQSGAIGHHLGNEFEKLIEQTPDLQEKLVRTIDDLEPGSYTSYFNFTGGKSDVDMTVVRN